MLGDFRANREYGSAVHYSNIVLGRIAVSEGKLEDAKKFLIEAGQAPPTPYLAANGPNMALAKDLLETGEKQVVLDYIELCRNYWTDDGGRLNQWVQDVNGGKVPDFGPNLAN